MIDSQKAKARDEDLVNVLGYMHFSSGRTDPKMLAAMNRLYGLALDSNSSKTSPFAGMPAWLTIQQWLQDRLTLLGQSQPTFLENEQAASVLSLVWMDLLPSYLDFHRDLLFHQEPEGLFNGLFLGRSIEIILSEGGPWLEHERIIPAAIEKLNSFVGYRPIAVLENAAIEPYKHEFVCPLPLFLADVGVAEGPYELIIAKTLEILRQVDASILRSASFDPAMLLELAVDPRAYDFDHPVNKRPNYQFGTWDMRSADAEGYYRRFVIQQVTLDSLLARALTEPELPPDELMDEAATVLAGTILMASGITGWGPAANDSTVSLVNLLGPIAHYRDKFYTDVLARMSGAHADRLRAEESRRRQPFGGVRQHLNAHMAKLRASQLEHVQLARLFARMGSADSAKAESDNVPVPSARIACRIDCLLTTGKQLLQNGNMSAASKLPDDIVDLIHRGIECGALVDPWNILGFSGNFPYFQSSDAASEDHRIVELNELLERVSAYFSRLWREASAADNNAVAEQIRQKFSALANWWHQFAAHEIEDVGGINLLDSFQSAELVAKALRLWHEGGAASGDVRFWAENAELFDSPRAYALVIEALLERDDFISALALLVHWLGEAENTGLRSGETSFADLSQTWFYQLNRFYGKAAMKSEILLRKPDASAALRKPNSKKPEPDDEALPTLSNPPTSEPIVNPIAIEAQAKCWALTKRFFDFVEANAESYWKPPKLNLGQSQQRVTPESDSDDGALADGWPDESEDSPFNAAYEGVVFEDSTNDGNEGATYEVESETDDELQNESRRLIEHLNFLVSISQMWKHAALQTCLDRCSVGQKTELVDARIESLQQWCVQCGEHLVGCLSLLDQIRGCHVARGGSDLDSMARYDRKRLIKESLLERAIQAAIEIADSRRMLLAAIMAINPSREKARELLRTDLEGNDWEVVELFSSLLAGERDKVLERFNTFLANLRKEKLLYVPVSRGGQPNEIFQVRLRRRSMCHLVMWLPRQGLFSSAGMLLETARHMEHHNPVGPGGVTEFDDLFQIAFTAAARAVVRNAYALRPNNGATPSMELDQIVAAEISEPAVPRLNNLIERTTEVLLHSWLNHSRTLRLSILEVIDSQTAWDELTEFIKKYGRGVFTQGFLKLSNVRAILHQGVDAWLRHAIEQQETSPMSQIIAAIDSGELKIETTVKWMSVILETILDHNVEYRDYNSTTTQSDRGEMIYMLIDFLRLRVRYERVCWNLKPVFLAHEVLVRNGCQQTAQQWRRALAERVGVEAQQYLKELNRLQELYAMRMPTVADRLSERFLKPMSIGRMRALVRPAMKQLQRGGGRKISAAFELLLQEAHLLMREPSGVGFDIPEWLLSLHEEVDYVIENRNAHVKNQAFERAVPFVFLRPPQIEAQFDAFEKSLRTRKIS